MSFIEMPGINDAKEPKVVPEGVDYDLIITSAKLKEKEGKQNVLIVLEIEGYPDAGNVMHNLSLIGANDEEETRKFKLLMAKRFFHQFGIEADGGFEIEQLVGHRASGCKLQVDIYEGQKNNKLKLDPLPTEESEE